MIDQFKKNLAGIDHRIKDAAKKSGRLATDVTLVAVTKYVDADVTGQLVKAGCTQLGESRPQLLWEKAASLTDSRIQWHMIGHLQRNKVKRTLPLVHLIHSVDSTRLLDAIHKAAKEQDLQSNLLLEINVSGEPAKHGFAADQLQSVLEHATTLPNVCIKGLMCMAGLQGNLDDARRNFSSLRETRDQHADFQTDNVKLTELSMGMSGDFDVAIEEGATIVRVGSLIFG